MSLFNGRKFLEALPKAKRYAEDRTPTSDEEMVNLEIIDYYIWDN